MTAPGLGNRLLRLAALFALAGVAAACTPGSTTNAPPGPAEHPRGVGVSHAAQLPAGASVFVIVLENATYETAISTAGIRSLAQSYGEATNYHAVAHPSLPNYLALTSGSTFGIQDDAYHRLPLSGIGAELSRKAVPWRAYMDGMTAGCLDNSGAYAVKHNPFAYYGAACPPNVVPLSRLADDLSSQTPRFAWITPGLCNDGHDCGNEAAARFAVDWTHRIVASPAWQRGGVLYIVWDESRDEGARSASDASGNHVLCLVIARERAARRVSQTYSHYSLLATIEDQLGVARSGSAAGVDAMTPFFGGGSAARMP